MKKKENAIEVSAYPITQEKEFDVYYPLPNHKGQVAVDNGIQNVGRRSKGDMTRSEYPLVPLAAPRLNLSKVNFKKDFFIRDYRVNGEIHDDPYYQGYDRKPKKIDYRFLEDGEEEKLEYLDAPLSQNNFTARGTKDFMRLMSHRAPIIQDSHGAHFDSKDATVPLMYSNINYGDERTTCCNCQKEVKKRYFRTRDKFTAETAFKEHPIFHSIDSYQTCS